MKIMVASDIHGSGFYCKQLVEAFHREGAEKLVLLGDILYHGPRNALPEEYGPPAVVDLLNGIKDKILCVRGNCDSEVDQMVLEFSIMADFCTIFLGDRTVFVTHGHLYSEYEPPMLCDGDILLCGHTHVPKIAQHAGYYYVNPGSVSIPKEGSPHSYMIMTEEGLEWKNLEGESYKSYSF